jgi:hypothetical protein
VRAAEMVRRPVLDTVIHDGFVEETEREKPRRAKGSTAAADVHE